MAISKLLSSPQFWAGTLITIPLSIFANFASSYLDRLWSKFQRNAALRKNKKLIQDYVTVKLYQENPDQLTHYLLASAIKIIVISSVVAILVMTPGAVFSIINGIFQRGIFKSFDSFSSTIRPFLIWIRQFDSFSDMNNQLIEGKVTQPDLDFDLGEFADNYLMMLDHTSSLGVFYSISFIFSGILQFFALIGVLMIINNCRESLTTLYRVINFDSFEDRVNKVKVHMRNSKI